MRRAQNISGSGLDDVTWRLYQSPRYGMSFIGRIHTNALAFSETVENLIVRVDYSFEIRIPWNVPRYPIKLRMRKIDEDGRGVSIFPERLCERVELLIVF